MNETLVIALGDNLSHYEQSNHDNSTLMGFREMTQNDIPTLVELWRLSYPERLVEQTPISEVIADWTASFNDEYGKLEKAASLVVERDRLIFGAIQTVIDAPWDQTPTGPFIIELLVHPKYRRAGIGKALLTEALRQLKQRGYQSAGLRVENDNLPAQTLYQVVGFTEWMPGSQTELGAKAQVMRHRASMHQRIA